MKRIVFVISLLFAVACTTNDEEKWNFKSAVIESFETVLSGDADYKLGYATELLIFEHYYDETYGSWCGFAQSKCYDMEDASYENQYSVYNEKAASGDHFLLYYYDTYHAENNQPTDILCRYYGDYKFNSVRLCLSTFTYHAIVTGSNAFARPFDEGDYIKVTFIALGENKSEGESVEFYIADYRDGKRFVATDWTSVDLTPLQGELWGIRVRVETTDVGEWGPNTPLYICMDDLTYSVTI